MISRLNHTLVSADKTHLVNLIATLKSEVATTNELLNIKNDEFEEFIIRDNKLLAAHDRIKILEQNGGNKMVCNYQIWMVKYESWY